MDKPQLVIAHVLAEVGEATYSTKLVKLVYLVDYVYAQQFGRTLTGFRYMWDHFGPNALGHAIVGEAEKLASAGHVACLTEPNVYGGLSVKFRAREGLQLQPLQPEEMLVIRHVVAKFGRMSVPRIVNASKKTEPFRLARQYDELRLPPGREMEGTTEEDVTAYRRSVEEQATVTLEELKKELLGAAG